jgi:aminopeptidase YwaD
MAIDLDKVGGDAYAKLEGILDELGPSESATDQESDAPRHLKETFLIFGYATEIQTFPVIGKELAGMGLALIDPQRREFVALPMTGSGLGDVSGILTPVGLAMPGDMPETGLPGRVALAKRGVIPFQSKAENVFAAGATGLVVYDNAPGIFQGSLAGESEFPVISISGVDGEAIKELLADSEV